MESRPRILVVDDEENIRHYLQLLLEQEGFEVRVAENAVEGLHVASTWGPDVILCDLRMPGEFDGLGLVERLQELPLESEVIMMSAYGRRETALEAVRRGAYDYIDKPIDRDDLVLVLQKFFERKRLRVENRRLQAVLADTEPEDGLVFLAESMQRVVRLAKKVALFPSNVLLQGENGTGKELFARLIHRRSERREQPFVPVNCGSIPENLFESELFGHVRGAFTGAHRERVGLFEAAHGGTLFLDEVSELPISMQVKLLRVLQEGVIRRVGDSQTREMDVRVIAATNRDLAKEVESEAFREDLFYRLRVVMIAIPPLRERREDIPPLVDFYLKRLNARFGTLVHGIHPDAMRILVGARWPGNVRQLKNTLEQAIVFEDSDLLTLRSLPEELAQEQPEISANQEGGWSLPFGMLSIKQATRELERFLIQAALEETQGNRTAASRLLEISHRSLLYKIKEYGLS